MRTHNSLVCETQLQAIGLQRGWNKSFSYIPDLTWFGLVYPIYLTPPLGQDMTQGQFLSGV